MTRLEITKIDSAIRSRLERIGFVHQKALTWKRRRAEGVDHVEAYVYKRRYMPRHGTAFSCVFSVCNMEIWPVLKDRVSWSEAPSTYASSMYHVKGKDDGSVLDAIRGNRFRAGDYGYVDSASFDDSVGRFERDIDEYVVPFFETFYSWKQVFAEVKSGSQAWSEQSNPRLLIALNTLSCQRDIARNQLERFVRREAAVDSLIRFFSRRKGRHRPQGSSAPSLRRFVETIGAEQRLIDEAGERESMGSHGEALAILEDAAKVNASNEFIKFRMAVSHFRAGRIEEATSLAQEVAISSLIYSKLGRELFTKCLLEQGDLRGAQGSLEEINLNFFEENGYHKDVSLSDFAHWFI